MEDNKAPWAMISISIDSDKVNKYREEKYVYNGKLNGSWRKSDILFEEWLTQKEYLKNSRIMPEDIVSATVEKCETKQDWDSKFSSSNDYISKNITGLEISDKNQLEACLRNYKYLQKENQDKYIIKFNTKINNILASFYGSFDETSVPKAIKSYFN
jgi:hypothetical protein